MITEGFGSLHGGPEVYGRIVSEPMVGGNQVISVLRNNWDTSAIMFRFIIHIAPL